MRRLPLAVAFSAAILGLVAPLAAGAVTAPIPPGPADPTLEEFVGSTVSDRPLTSPRVPQHPFMAATGTNSMHNDSYATDAYRGGGPTGRSLTLDSATYGAKECATITFDSRGRIVGLCGGVEGFQLMLIDPESLEPRAVFATSTRDVTSGANPLTDLCGGAYFYLDHRDRAVVETADGRVLVVQVTADGFELAARVRRHARAPRG